MIVSKRLLIIMAALVWYSGGIALMLKGGSLAKSAHAINPDSIWVFLAPIIGIVAGLIKARFIFIKNCTKNILRIKALIAPRLWQCFRPGMLIFLAIIIPTGAMMSKAAAGNFTFLCIVCALDLSICIALLTSSMMFWKLRAFDSV